MNIYEKIIEVADKHAPRMIAQRRDFHKYAETGWLEMRTSSIIARYLKDMGYEVLVGEDVCDKDARMGVPNEDVLEACYRRAVEQGADPEFVEATRGGMTGVIGILRCGEGPTVAMRFDIDALGVIESDSPDHIPAAEGFASVNHGSMHACGHDGHACSGLCVAAILMEIKDQLHGTVKLIFQPSEEGVRGAKSIVEKGHLDDVDYFFCAHTTAMDEEESDITPGVLGSMATGKYDVTFHGRSAHAGGTPHLGKNALMAAATATLNLYAIPRHKDITRVNVGKLIAGSGRNVIADEAFMEIELRGKTTELNNYMYEHAVRILKAAADMHDCTMEMKLMGAAESVQCDDALVKRFADICANKLGMKVSSELYLSAIGGSEDVSYMTNRVLSHGGQATFLRIRIPCKAVAHNRMFDFDESYITKTAKVMCAGVYDIMK